jgi:oligoendopeptidase F
MQSAAHIQPLERTFLPASWQLTTWDELKPYWDNLATRTIPDRFALQQWLKDWSELEAVISEEACWRQIQMTRDTQNEHYEKAFTYYVTEIEPQLKPFADQLNKKLLDHPLVQELDEALYFPFLRNIKNQTELFTPANIPLAAEANLLAQQFGTITSGMTVDVEGTTLTLQQAAAKMHSDDRELRKKIFDAISTRRLENKDELDDLFDQLLKLRHQIALNAGFDNYRDFKFRELGRFDYTVADCEAFHTAVAIHIVPLHEQLLELKRQALGVDTLAPYDLVGEPKGQQALRPFKNGNELLEHSKTVLGKLKPFYAECLNTMQQMERLDLESRIGKAPGGYNCPLAETGVPFIFMNAAGTLDDVITMMHESGHAIHSFLSHPLPLTAFKEYPMEIAELASMSMELFTMQHWDVFFQNPEELQRAKLEELERVIDVLPWVATIDHFQHWLYTHPGHTREQRSENWERIYNIYAPKNVHWTGYEAYKSKYWQKQLHLFEVPFYYIEYGIAQLGAIAMWRQFLNNPESTLNNYEAALAAGYTKTLRELYHIAGISFDFSSGNILSLAQFVHDQMQKIATTNE